MDENAEILSADDTCPVCQTAISDKGQYAGIWDGDLGWGAGNIFVVKCAACGVKLIGWEYAMDDPNGGEPVCHIRWDARRLHTMLPRGPRVAILGSTAFWHAESERTCAEIGRLLAGIPGLVLLTGGVEGIGEAVGRSFHQARCDAGQEPRIYHVLPEGESAWDYGQTLYAGADMSERREALGRMSEVYVMVEGGPGAGHEADVAATHGAIVIPVGRSGGYAATLYDRVSRPPLIDTDTWAILGASVSTPEATGKAVLRAVLVCLDAVS